MRVYTTNENFMKRAKLVLFFWLIGWAMLKGQNPVLSVSPGGSMSVCPGATVAVNANVANAFAGTTNYNVGDIPFSPYSLLGGTNVTMPDDTVLGPFPIGFQFCFYGNTYTQFYLSSNGWIGFSPGMTRAFTANSIPSTNMFVPRNCIMGPWMDFNPGIAGGPYIKYQTQGIAPYRRLVVQWLNVPLYQCIALKSTFQIVIFESTNTIENHITSKPTCMAWAGGKATQGLHNLAGSAAITVAGRNAAVWTATNDGKRFTPNGPPSYTVNWTANGIPAGSGATTSIVSGPGNKRVIARVNFQCSNLILYDTLDINVGGASSAAFSIPSLVCAGQPASFTYTGGAAGTGAWTFGSGTPNSVAGLGTQTSTWATPGTYPVTLNVTPSNGACLPASLTQNVIVSAPPTSTFTLPASLCLNANGTLTYSGSAPAGSTYLWDFGAGASPATASTAGPQTVSWSTAGSKTVTLTVISGTCSSTSTNTITVNAAPTAAFTVNPSPVCAMANATVTYTGTAAAGSTYTWNFGLGASPLTATGLGPHTVSWGSNGSKTVGLTVTTSGCSATASQSVVVNPIPNSPFVLPTSVCVGANASITYAGSAAAPPGATYNWNVGGGLPAPGNVQGPFSVNWATAGSKTLTLSVTQSGCTSATTTQNITVNPTPTVAVAATPSTVCVGQTSSLAVTGATPVSGSTYSWSFGATASPTTSSSAGPINVSWSNAGSFAPSLIVTSNGCASAPASATVTVNAPPTASITIPSSGCVGVPVSISAAGTYPLGSTFTWNFGTGTVISGSGAGPYSVQWAAGGNQSVSFTVTSGSCTASASSIIIIRSGPLASFTAPASLCANQNGTITFTGSAAVGATYAWNFGANATPSTATTVGPHTVSWTSPGSKTVSLTITDGGCAPVTASQTVVINPGYTATFSMPASTCQNVSGTVAYTGNAPAGSTYAWNFGAGATPATATTAGPHNVGWSTIGTSTVTLSVTTAGCVAGPVSQNIVVSGPPTSTFNLPATVCASTPLSISYTGNASAGATFNWSFPGGSPASATGIGPHTFSWANAGVFNVSLSVVQNGCTSTTTTNSIQVYDAPTNTFTIPTSACIGQSVSAVYAGNATAGATYVWNFGSDATPSSASTLGPHSVSWSASGSKTASLVVTQNGCSVQAVTRNITINTAPTSTFTVTSPECVNEAAVATYTGNAGPSATYVWTYPNGSWVAGSGPGPLQLIWPSAGTQSVTLAVTENGCTSTISSQNVVIQAAPSFSVSAPTYAGINISTLITYTGTPISGATYSWNFDGGTIVSGSGAGPYQIQWATAGVKNLSCTVISGACNLVTETAQTQVISAATVSFVAESPVCVNSASTVTFNGMSLPGAVFNWNFDGGTVVSGSGVGPYEISWPTAGSKNITLSVDQFGVSSPVVTENVVVNSTPTASFSIPAFICQDQTASINYTGSNPGTATFNWNFDGGNVIGAASANNLVSFPSAGMFDVSLQVTQNGCTSAAVVQSIDVRPVPVAAFTLASSACSNAPVTVNFTGTANAGATFNWNFGGATVLSGSGAGPYSLSWATAGSNTVTLSIIQNQCTSAQASQNITINQTPVASFTAISSNCSTDPVSVTFTGTADPTATYTWNLGPATLVSGSGQGPLEATYSTTGTFNFGLTVVQNGCTASASGQSITLEATPIVSFNLTDTTYAGISATALFTGSAPSTVTYSWDYPSAQWISGSATGPLELSWAAPGTYPVELTLENNGCTPPSVIENIVVLPFPGASFNADNDTACVSTPMWINYNGSVVPNTAYNWNFDGATVISGSGVGPYQLVWNTPGVKNVEVSITINGLTGTPYAMELLLLDIPVASFSMPEEACAGEEVQLNYTSTTNVNALFQWTFNGGTPISGDETGSPIVRWDTSGLKSVSLSVADAMCISAPVIHQINIKALPVASYQLDTIACRDAEVTVSFIGSANVTADFIWDFGGAEILDGSAVGPFQIKWNTAGTYQVQLGIIENGCSSLPSVTEVVVRELPLAEAGTVPQLCSGDTVSFSPFEDPAYSYNWTPSGGLSDDSIATPNLTLNSIHTYVENFTYTLRVFDGYCSSSDSVEVSLAPVPNAFFAHPEAQCMADHSVDLVGEGGFDASAIYTWNLGPHAFQHSPNDKDQQGMEFDIAGTHILSLVVIQYGCTSATYLDSVVIHANPIADFDASHVKGCLPLSPELSAVPVEGSNVIYQWSFGDGNTGLGIEPDNTYNTSGYMSVSLTVTDDNGCSSSKSVPNFIQVLEQPIAGFRATPEILFIGVDELQLTSLSQNAMYSYYVINQDTILGATNSYNFNEPGEYPITQVVVNGAGCTDEITHIVKVEYGTEYYIPAAFTPNNDGKNDVFKVEGSEILDFNLVIFDRWGHEIFSSSDITSGWDGKSPASAQPVPEGVYIFRVEMKNKQNRDIVENGSVTLLR